MSNQFLKLRRSAVPGKIPTTSSLEFGEIALNTYDGLAFMKRSGSNGEEIITIGSTSGSFTGSLFGTASWAINSISASFSQTSSFALTASYFSGSITNSDTASLAYTASSADNFIIRGDLTGSNALFTGTVTAQKLFVQTITSSVLYSSGSNQFGNKLTDTQQFTGSVTITGSLGISGPITEVDYIQFETTSSGPNLPGKLIWNNNDGTLNLGMKGGNVTLQIGQEFLTRVHNLEPTTIVDGQLVAFSGSVGDKIGVKLADATFGLDSSNLIGMVTEAILPGEEGFVTYRGFVRDLNTTPYLAGEPLFLDTVPGGYNNAPPDPPNASAAIGYAVIIDSVTGSIYVDIKPHYALGGIDNVLDNTTTTSYGDLLIKSGSVWTNSKSLTGSYSLTGSLIAHSFTGSLKGTASWAEQAITASYVQTAQSASYVLNSVSSSFASTASYVQLAQTASYVQNAQSASYVLQAVSASFATTASFVTLAQTASFITTAQTASYVQLAQSASYVQTAQTASFVTASNVYGPYGSNSVFTASYAVTAAFALNAGGGASITVADEGNAQGTATFFNFTGAGVTATVASNTASINIPGGTGDTFPYTGSAIISGSLQVTGSVSSTGGFTGSLLGTASWAENAITASYVLNALSSSFATTASFVTLAQTASYILQAVSSSFTSTASFAQLAQTASYITGSNVYGPFGSNSILSSSYALTASFALNAGGATSTITNQISSGSVTASVNINSASFQVTSGSTNLLFVSNSGLITAQRLFLSSSQNMSSGSTLVVFGSGSAQPVFTVQGSQGELFSVNDSLSGSLFSVNDISGLPIIEAFSDNRVFIGSYQAPMLTTTVRTTLAVGNNIIYQNVPTASYDAVFFEYSLKSGSNARAGSIMGIWSGSDANYNEVVTTDFGDTTGVKFMVMVTGSNVALTGSATTANWTMKTIVRSI